ncbi:pyridoxal-phosphate dependent enzyme, partial [Caulobacter sp. HMWF009]
IWGVEPAGFDETRRSLDSGRRETIDPEARSICDALLTPIPGELTFPINQANLAGIVAVTDGEVAEAMRYAFSVLKLVVEPGGCVALAAALAGKVDLKGQTAAIVLSGGNVDPDLFARVLAGEI